MRTARIGVYTTPDADVRYARRTIPIDISTVIVQAAAVFKLARVLVDVDRQSQPLGGATMFGIRGRKSFWIVATLLGLFFIFSVLVAPYINPPRSTTHSFLIDAGGVSRAIVGSKDPDVSRPGTFVPPYQPHHIDFASSNGPVDVYVVRYAVDNPEVELDRLTRLTEQLQAGNPLEEYLAKGIGNQGRIDLAGWWPFGWAKSVVLVHSQNESEVQVVVHYGPNSDIAPDVPVK